MELRPDTDKGDLMTADDDLKTWECVGYFIKDPFEAGELVQRVRLLVQAADRREAFAVGQQRLFEVVINSNWADLVNAYVRESDEEFNVNVPLAELEAAGQLRIDFFQVH
jgi:hypothetical protein